jgi:hypothetical protein
MRCRPPPFGVPNCRAGRAGSDRFAALPPAGSWHGGGFGNMSLKQKWGQAPRPAEPVPISVSGYMIFYLESLCPKKGVWNFQALKTPGIY